MASTTDGYQAQLKKRWRLLNKAADDPQLQALLLERCRRDPVFWFNHFCWTYDPRESTPHRPFVLYPFQEALVRRMCEQIERGEDLLIEKSRDMGVSWLVLLVFQYYWLFFPGSNFHLGSRKLESVDRLGDLSTLFEKLRYNLRWLPAWMRPEGFIEGRHDAQFKLIHPGSGNIITGESGNEHFARGGRYRAVLFDEFQVWSLDEAAFASAGQSAPCRVVVGTPYGKNNKFAELRFHSSIEVATLHWTLHPGKDEVWYARQKQRMSEAEIARELDINYHRSLEGRVFREFTEVNKAELSYMPGRKVIRSWDFGYHCPACVFLQIDDQDRVVVLHEIVGRQELVRDFAKRVLDECRQRFPDLTKEGFEDVCDPAGAQRSDKTIETSIEILNSLGVYPYSHRSQILDGLELIRMKLTEMREGSPCLRVDRGCKHLIDAFEGGYRYKPNGGETPLEEHPYEDVMDCLRYALIHKCGVHSRKAIPVISRHKASNRYTGY